MAGLNVEQTKQQEFAVVMLQKLKEEKASNLIDYAEKATVSGADTYTFYRLGESSVGNDKLNMYKDDYQGTGGTAEQVACTINYVYAHDKIGLKQVKSTQLNLENSYIKSLSDALRRNCDKVILSAISAKTSNLKKIGDQLKDITDDANVTALIKGVAYASTLVNESSVSDGRSGVAIVLDTAQYAQLFGVDKVINAQYPSVNEIRTRNSLFGADVVKVASATKGADKIYIIPAGTIGVASYENDIDAKAWWDDGQDSLFCRVRRSLGVAVLEPESIFEFSHKAIA